MNVFGFSNNRRRAGRSSKSDNNATITSTPASIPKYFVGTKLEKLKIKKPAATIIDVENIGELIELYTDLMFCTAVEFLSLE
jgi:hypothetical protein